MKANVRFRTPVVPRSAARAALSATVAVVVGAGPSLRRAAEAALPGSGAEPQALVETGRSEARTADDLDLSRGWLARVRRRKW
ncbi:hypothetical protein [Phytohabitans suffuscus]